MRGCWAGARVGGIAPRPVGLGSRLGGMVAGSIAVALTAMSCLGAAHAASLSVDPEAVGGVLRSLEAPGAVEAPVIHQTDEGFIRFLGAPPGGSFLVREDGTKAAGATAVASTFVEDHSAAFGIVSDATNFRQGPVRSHDGYDYVRLEQFYEDLPVFGAQIVVQVNESLSVQNVLSDIMRDTRALDDGSLSLDPAISGGRALAAAINAFADASDAHRAADFTGVGTPELVVFRPAVVGLDGGTHLVWKLRIAADGPPPVLSEVFVDAHSTQIVLHYSLLEHVTDRQVFNAGGSIALPSEPARVEGGAPTGIAAVDDTYEFLGDTYNFYFDEHRFDSFDGNGATIVATVNVPFLNACWGCTLDPRSLDEGFGEVTEMLFGTGLNLLEVVAHEYTHGVTQFTSGLIYFGFSGAINESFSDMWGEWIDLTKGGADADPENRWVIGDGLEPFIAALLGGDPDNPGIRNMKDPTLFGHPDRLGSPFLFDVTSFINNGGVHINSGIGNKLAYLLTDGDTFNGQTVEGMGISAAARLFFGTQFLLSPGSDYHDLYLALGASAISQRLTFEQRLNIANAGKAVEIVPPVLFETGLRDFRATPTTDRSGTPVIVLSWTNPDESLFSEVYLLRSTTGFPNNLGDGEELARGTLSQYLDREVTAGTTYYYSVIVDLEGGLPQVVSAQATAGAEASSALTEAFGQNIQLADGSNTVDLAYSQLIFTPVGPPLAPFGSGTGGGTYEGYEATFIPDVFSLPVLREDDLGRALDITVPQDSGVTALLGERSFPFFGQAYSQLYIAANGYISFQPVAAGDTLNFASLASHFAIPRISYFFAGAADLFDSLASSAGGSLWLRFMDERVVLTYENVPQFNPFAPTQAGATSTVQVELFFSGMIRITYLDAVATAAVVGLSDGRGVPVDPATLFPDVVSAGGLTDLSTLPEDNIRLRIEPVAAISAEAGALISFNVTAIAPSGSATAPQLTGQWNGPVGLPFADNGDGTGTFYWQTALDSAGTYQLRVTARADGQVAYQDITIQVGDVLVLPSATGLTLSAGEPGEDATSNRAVSTESALTAAYTYSHPLQTGSFSLYDEGTSVIYWYRNNQIVTSLTNRFRVTPQATRGGDQWYFGVVPVTVLGYAGPIAFSPVVTISAIPEIVSITPAAGGIGGGDAVRIRGNRLGAPISVSFGGALVSSIRAISEGEIEVITPLHAPGAVDVVVKTIDGDGILRNGFTYLGEGSAITVTDVNGDGKIDALDVQLVVNAVLATQTSKLNGIDADVNRDGRVNALDIQMVVNKALLR